MSDAPASSMATPRPGTPLPVQATPLISVVALDMSLGLFLAMTFAPLVTMIAVSTPFSLRGSALRRLGRFGFAVECLSRSIGWTLVTGARDYVSLQGFRYGRLPNCCRRLRVLGSL